MALLGVLAALSTASPAMAEGCASAANPIVCENALPGDPESDWQVGGTGAESIQGYATSMSVNTGQTEYFKIKTPSSSYHIDILRLGYYQGTGARLIASGVKPTAQLPQSQPACLTNSSTGLIDCGSWGVSASWTVPSDAVSGIYIAHLMRDDTTGEDSQIIFVVRNDASHSSALLQTSDATWQAYNAYGGNSLYSCTVACPAGEPETYKAAYAVSYNRPFATAAPNNLYYGEYPMIRFLEKNGYDVSYTSEAEVDQHGPLLKNHKMFISSGHDEYWSAGQRANVLAAREAGVNLAFFSGNELFWKTRWGPSTEGSNTPYRTLTSYKETHFRLKEWPVDPLNPPIWTGTWRDPRFSPPADGGLPENAVTGQQFEVNSGTRDITVPSQYGKLRLWRNTAVPNLQPGQTLTLARETLGYEWDEDVDNGFRPAGEFDLSSTTANGVEVFKDYGSTLELATATHHLTQYRVSSGALVFGAGTVQWAWGLDDSNPGKRPPDPNMEQATVNLLADMGAQPGSLDTGLLRGTQSTDTTPPTSTITSPTQGQTLQDGSQVTISGTASEAGGGVVAGVEVSTDSGTTWHPATLTTPVQGSVSWSYTWAAHGHPTTTIKSRAVDDSSNLEAPSAGVPVNVSCPCSIWGTAVTPPTPDFGDTQSGDLGVKFTTKTFGKLTGIRFYKSAANTGTHIGNLWSASGERLATATFENETTSGWQQVNFSTPVYVLPGETYVASYFDPAGHYAATPDYFYTPPATGGNALNSPPLHAVPASTSSANGVYSSGATSTFPTSTYNGTNYWVDVVFEPVPVPGQVTNVSATEGRESAKLTWSAPAGGGPVTTYKITPFIGTQEQPATTVTGSPPATSATVTGLTVGTSYTFTVQASNPNGSGPASDPSNAVTPTPPTTPSAPTGVTASAATSQALVSWSASASDGGSPLTSYTVTSYIGTQEQQAITVKGSPPGPSAAITGLTNGRAYTFKVTAANKVGSSPPSDASGAVTPRDTIFDFARPQDPPPFADPTSVELGVKFTSELAGTVTGIRFFKSAANTGTHIGSLWSASGQPLATATFENETTSGWQQVSFSTPVAIDANTTYVAAYLAPHGNYSFTHEEFAMSGVSNPPLSALANSTSPNGVFAESTTSTFPNASYLASNYWVDVDFEPLSVPGQVTNVSATAGKESAILTWNAPADGGPVTSYTITPYIGPEAQPPTTVTGSPPATGATVTGLTVGTSYTFTVRASNPNGPGPASDPSNAVTPTSTAAPSPPRGVTASAATSQVLVSWSAPASDGGSPLTSYTVTPYVGSTAQTPVGVQPNATSTIVKGLTNGTSYTFKVTAANEVGNSPPSGASGAVTPQNTIFDFATPPAEPPNDHNSNELGVKFSSELAGTVTGIRFYKSAANTGVHVGSLWSASGTLLASATFTNESASGWQQVNFSTPVAITANTTYVAAYLAPNGEYSFTHETFATSGVSNPPLSALANSISANGVYTYSPTSTFPHESYRASNYWVDVDFAPSPPCSAAPSITEQPASQTVTAPAGASFTVKEGAVPSYCSAASIQWQVSTDAGLTWSNVLGATSATLSINPTSTSESGNEYRAVLTNASARTDSSAATLTVNPPPCSAAPSITEQPASQTLTAPNAATFTAAASTPPNCAAPTVQWYSQAPASSSFSPISGATSASYTTPATTTAQSGTKYEAVLTNSFGSTTTSAALLTVKPPAANTFGKTTVGSSSNAFAAERKWVNRYALAEAGSVTKLSVYLAPRATSGQQVLKGVIYSDASGKPAALLAVTEQLTFKSTNAARWYALPLASAVKLAAGNYWIGVITGATSQVAGLRYDSVTGSRDFNFNAYSSGPTNPFGTATVDGERMSLYATYTPAPPRPSNETPPTITGTAQRGRTLTEVHGKWKNRPSSFAYQWLQCDSIGSGCLPISGATSQTYVPVAGDVGHTIAVQESASNAGGSGGPVTSSATAVVQQGTRTFGKTTIGASSDTFASERKRVNHYALPEAGSVTKLSVYLAPTKSAGQQLLKAVIYSDASGKPAALLGVSEALTFKSTNAGGWYDLPFASPVKLAVGNYWIGVITGATPGVAGWRYDSVTSARAYNANTYAAGPTNPFGAVTTDNQQASLYATY